jgi:3-phenylpropionate/trans-cinnamate dioxygenase ferredoxin reductase subunit
MSRIVVIGAGQAGASLVARLRKQGFDGEICLLGAEPVLPYQRPPLSKKYLTGEMELERLFLRPRSFYDQENIDLRLDTQVTQINPSAKTISLGAEKLAYDQLALTTGSVPRNLPASIGGALGGVYTVRNLADVDAMAPEFRENARVLIVGGGYIGLEAASVAASRGLSVTLVEMADRILQRVASPQTSDFFRNLHQSHGVDIREGVGLDRLTGETRVQGAILTNGDEIAVDFVIVGVGIEPDIALAQAAGLEIENGIKVDALGRTSDASIYAAGDCCSFPHHGGRLRLESVPNAIDQAEAVADAMLGGTEPYLPNVWFWSDQYDVTLQIAGLNSGYTDVVTRKDGERISFWYFKDETLLAVDAVRDARAYMLGKRWLAQGVSPSRLDVADPSLELKTLTVT